MEDKKEKISEIVIPAEASSENVKSVREAMAADASVRNENSVLVSVNSFKSDTQEEIDDDDLLTIESINERVQEDDRNLIRLIDREETAEDARLTYDSNEELLQEDDRDIPDTDDIVAYNVEAFEDDHSDTDHHSKRMSAKKIGCISCSTVLLLMVFLLAFVTASFYHYYHLMEIDDEDTIYFNDNVSFSDAEMKEIPEGEVELEEGAVFKDKDVYNILLIGTDERTKGFNTNARADSIMILSFDNRSKRIRLVSLERGMLVSIPGRKNDILTHTFRYGGSQLLMDTVRTHFKVDVDKYIRVNFSVFQKLVDEVGGVDITLTEKEAYGLNTYPNHNTWKLKRKVYAGENHFNGYEALQYARLRWIDDDLHRIERQRKVIISIKESMTDLTVSDLKDISADCLPYIQTNITAVELADLLIKLPGFVDNDTDQMTIPAKGTYQTLGHVDFKENAVILHQFLYGSKENDQQ